ncbi:MAG TPA: hypothetical protein VEI01_02435 [Terriglobales bacterium]|nr:hypothetical protein [Terriglobales bacterium]
MQVHLTIEEFELLRQILRDQTRVSQSEAPSCPQAVSDAGVRDKLRIGCDLVGRGLSRNLQLGFDELEDLADCLHWRQRQLVAEISCSADPKLERESVILEHILEKVTEACAMV